MKKSFKYLFLAILIVLGVSVCTQGASAATKKGWTTTGGYTYYYRSNGTLKTGWLNLKGKYYYLRKTADGDAPVGSRVTGFYEIDGYTYYFSSKGVRQTGWKTIKGSTYYFKKKSNTGAMYTGKHKIGKYYYYFAEDGKLQTGWKTINGNRYYFRKSGSAGKKGRAYTGWHNMSGHYYYFSSTGIMQKNRWVSNKYYVGSNGRRLVSCVTPDGYYVNSKGVKSGKANGWYKISGKYYYYKSGVMQTGWIKVSGKYYYLNEDGVRQTGWLTLNGNKYYLNSSGVRQTGWVTVSGKRYYFGSNGVMAVSTTVDGIEINEKGEAGIVASILIVAGHGQGDPGATARIGSTTYQESKLTREFADLVYDYLVSSGKPVAVTMYNQNYDLYQVNAGYKSGPVPNWKEYDYILEIHFDSGAGNTSGNGKYTGISMQVQSSKSSSSTDVKVASSIVKKVKSSTGFSLHGSGIFKRNDLLNMNTAYKKGVSYGLLEVAFVDDKDDMTFYKNHKKSMAKAVAQGLLSGLGL